jgi:Excalibur calcium-binding domain
MRRRSTAAAGALVIAVLSLGTGTASAATDLDCSDFATQALAQASFNATPGDPNDLDRDNDGIACETLPGSTSTEDGTVTGGAQVTTRPVGAVAAGDGSTATDGSALPYVLGGVAFAAAGGAAIAARRTSRAGA